MNSVGAVVANPWHVCHHPLLDITDSSERLAIPGLESLYLYISMSNMEMAVFIICSHQNRLMKWYLSPFTFVITQYLILDNIERNKVYFGSQFWDWEFWEQLNSSSGLALPNSALQTALLLSVVSPPLRDPGVSQHGHQMSVWASEGTNCSQTTKCLDVYKS